MKQSIFHTKNQSNSLKFHTWRLASCLVLSISLPTIAQAGWPVAVADNANTTSNQPLTIQVLENDIGENLELIEVNTTTNKLGSAFINADKKSVTYQSAHDFDGIDTFWYAFTDSEGRTNAAKVTITISEATRPSAWPSSENDTIETTTNTSIKIPVLNNDTGVGLKVTQVNASTVAWGQAEIVDNGKNILYTPPSDYTGTDEFWYVFSDKWGRTNAAKVTPKVKPNYNSWPTAESDHASVVTTSSIAIPVLSNDSGENLKIIKVNTRTTGFGSARIEENYIRYTPADNFTGQDSFWYAFEDARGRTNSAQVLVDVSENTSLSSIEFCDTTYTTDGTAGNTNTSSAAADASAAEISMQMKPVAFPTQEAGTFAQVGERIYSIREHAGNNEMWVLNNTTGTSQIIATYPSNERLYGVGIKDGVLYYSNTPTEQPALPDTALKKEVLLSHDGNELKTIGEVAIKDLYAIRLTNNTTATHFVFYGAKSLEESSPNIQYVMLNETSGSIAPVETVFADYRGVPTGSNIETLFLYNGISYSTNSTSHNNIYFSKIKSTDPYLTDPTQVGISGYMDRAIVSNDRLLITTRLHNDREPAVGTSNELAYTPFYPTLYAVDKKNNFVKLAVCNP